MAVAQAIKETKAALRAQVPDVSVWADDYTVFLNRFPGHKFEGKSCEKAGFKI